ncbi:MAG: hypothetical protein GXY76_04590 [Chloroflexi bacterium]|nr:hypothetical protein [Chloroflexota bacterium]
MSSIPSYILQQLIAGANPLNLPDGFQFALRNTVGSGTLTGVVKLEVDGVAVEPARLFVGLGEPTTPASEITRQKPWAFQYGQGLVIKAAGKPLEPGHHQIALTVDTIEIGRITVPLTLKF